MSAVLYICPWRSPVFLFLFSENLLNTETQITRALYGISSLSKFFLKKHLSQAALRSSQIFSLLLSNRTPTYTAQN